MSGNQPLTLAQNVGLTTSIFRYDLGSPTSKVIIRRQQTWLGYHATSILIHVVVLTLRKFTSTGFTDYVAMTKFYELAQFFH